MKNLLYLSLFVLVFGNLKAQTIAIPDYRFEQALVDLNIDSDGVINGQILVSDALNVTELVITPSVVPNYPYNIGNDYLEGLIHDVTGIEGFVNLESLTINVTMIEELNVSTLVKLKYLDCTDNMLTSIDVSNNILLEYLDISSGGDVIPFNGFSSEIDLSNNPNIHTLHASGGNINKINLKNNNNNENMFIGIGCWYCWGGYPPDYIIDTVCIEVDDAEIAQNNQYPYYEWMISHAFWAYNYTNDVETCSLSTPSFTQPKTKIYPNPVSDVLYFDTTTEKVTVFDLSGRKVLEQNQVNSIAVSELEKGNYIIRLVSNKGVQTEKIIVK
jgi:hypothetical protein